MKHIVPGLEFETKKKTMTATGPDHLDGKAVFVTGATGFIGKRLVPALINAGARVTVLLRNRHGRQAFSAMGARVIQGTAGDRALQEKALRNQDVLYHLAYDMRATATDNLATFETLRTAAEKAGVGRIVHASSIVVYDGWPQQNLTESSPISNGKADPYRRAKIAMEQALLQGNCPAAILQPTLVYGPGSMLWTDKLTRWLAAGTVVLPKPEGLCNAVFVDDLVQAMLCAAAPEDLQQERFIISGPTPVSWSALLSGYADIIGRGKIGLIPQETLRARLPDEEPGEVPDTQSLAARVSTIARAWIGRDRFEKLVQTATQRLPRQNELYPDRYMLELFSGTGQCQIDHARIRLGYEPAYDLKAGLEATRPYLEANFKK